MINVIFVCLGNICRSPMAELVFADICRKKGVSDRIRIDSFGTSDEEEGNGIYPPVVSELKKHGISGSHRAKPLSFDDVKNSDYVLAMEESNRRNVLRITGGRFADKVHLLLDYTDAPRDIVDPWYTRDFAAAYADISLGCARFFEYLSAQNLL